MPDPVVALDRVTRMFEVQRESIKAVDELSLAISDGEIVCLVGEPGCGMTTTGRMMVGLLNPSSGQILYHGRDVHSMNAVQRSRFRLGVQMVHRDPYASLNPMQRVYDIIAYPLRHHGFARGEEKVHDRVCELLETVGLTPPEGWLGKYPRQLSGGERQRVSIARALTVLPSLIIADEIVSMLDVSVGISLLDVLAKLRETTSLAVLFATHNLALARYFAREEGRIGVMYLGRLIEIGPASQVVDSPQHPYTQVLFSAVPEADPELTRRKERVTLRSMDAPAWLRRPTGCPFHPRCSRFAGEVCETLVPELRPRGLRQQVACHVA